MNRYKAILYSRYVLAPVTKHRKTAQYDYVYFSYTK